MGIYAQLDANNVAQWLVGYDDPAKAAADGAIGPLDNLNPQPGTGWGYDPATGSWTPSAQAKAAMTVAQLATEIPGYITQAQADVAVIATWQAGQPPDAAQITALNHWATGWVNLLEALQQLVGSL